MAFSKLIINSIHLFLCLQKKVVVKERIGEIYYDKNINLSYLEKYKESFQCI